MEGEIQKKLADALTGEALPISIKNNNSDEIREFEISQPTFKILIETSKILADIGINEMDAVFKGKDVFKFISNHGEKVLQVIAIILDKKIDYSPDTFEYLKENLTAFECYDLLTNITLRIGVQDFQKSIIGMIPMSLLNQEKMIDLIPKSLTRSNL